MNQKATDASDQDVLDMMHVTLKVGEPAHKFYMSHVANKVDTLDDALAAMQRQFFNDAVKNRAHQEFLQLDFAQFRRSKIASNETEVHAVNLFVAHAQNLQEQMPPSYQVDGVLRDRLVAAFSSNSLRLQDSFMDSLPTTSAEVTHRVVTRASADVGVDKLVAPEPTPYVNMVTDYVYRGNGTSRRGRGNRYGGNRRNFHRQAKGHRQGQRRDKACWVCGSLSHFARDRHSETEIRAARKKGNSPFVFAATIDEELAINVMKAELEIDDDSEEDSDEEVDSDPRDDIQVNFTLSHVDPPPVDENSEQINIATAVTAEEQAAIHIFFGQTHGAALWHNVTEGAHAKPDDQVDFGGLVIDTACIGASAVGQAEYARYCRTTGAEYRIIPDSSAMINFGDAQAGTTKGRVRSLGKAAIRFFLHAADLVFEFHVHVVPNCDLPLLISLNDLRKLRFDVHTLTETLHFDDVVQPLKRNSQGFLTLPYVPNVCLYTRPELQRFHRAYCHAHTDAVIRSLEAAGYQNLTPDDRTKLSEIAAECDPCQRRATAPQHYTLSNIAQDGTYNSVVQADVAHVSDGPFLHLRCKGSRLNAAAFSPTGRLTGRDVWNLIRKLWIECGTGPMNTLQVDRGSNLVSSEIQDACNQYGIHLDAVPTECPWRLGGVEMGHQAIKTAYEKLKSELPGTDKHEVMRLAVHAVNSAADENGVSPILTVYGVQPRPLPALVSAPLPDHASRIRAAKNAQMTLEKARPRRKHNIALKSKPPYPLEDLHIAVPGTEVLAFRRDHWEGPFPVAASDGADVTILTPNGRVTLERARVKPYRRTQQQQQTQQPHQQMEKQTEQQPQQQMEKQTEQQPQQQTEKQTEQQPQQQMEKQAEHQPQQQPQKQSPQGSQPASQQTQQQPQEMSPERSQQQALFGTRHANEVHLTFLDPGQDALSPQEPCATVLKTVVVPQGPDSASRFKASRKRELDGLMAQNCFEIRRRAEVVGDGDRVFGTRFVDTYKNAGTPEQFDKSRLVIQAYDDAEAESILTKSPTISRAGLRTALSLAASLPTHTIRTRDITQAYTNADTNVKRRVICEIPAELGLDSDEFVLLLVRPVYGLPEAGVHWHQTYVRHHEDMGFKGTALDPCLLFAIQNGIPSIICLQVDDSLGIMDAKTAQMEEDAAKRFPHKAPEILTKENSISFNGARISESIGEEGRRILKLDQQEKLLDLGKFTKGNIDAAGLISGKALGLYVSTVCRPDLIADFQLASASDLHNVCERAVSTASVGLTFVALDLAGPLRIVVFTDSSFSNNEDYNSQLGFLIVLADRNNHCNVLHYVSRKCKRVTRSVFAAELFALSEGFDSARAIADQVSFVLGRPIPVWAAVDSRTVFNVVARFGNVTEKRLCIDVAALREAHLTRALEKLIWVEGARNGSDPLTKKDAPVNDVFESILRNELVLSAVQWVERQDSVPGRTGQVKTEEE